jgi:hypothetical protein
LAESQKFCPILKNNRLGSMGTPVKLDVEGQPVFVCCEGCKEQALDDPQKTLAQVAKTRGTQPAGARSAKTVAPAAPAAEARSPPPKKDPDARIKAALAKLSPADRQLAEQQRFCPVLDDSRLGSMGTPVKLTIEGETVFICCAGCKEDAQANTKETLRKVKELKQENR